MASVNISVDKLREMLVAAYEAGWYGSLELKEQVAEDLLKGLEAEIPASIPMTTGYYVGPGSTFYLDSTDTDSNRPPLHPDAWQNSGDG